MSLRIRFFFALLAVFTVPHPSHAEYDRALESYLKEDYIRAAPAFDRFIARQPSDTRVASAVYFSALCRLKLDQPRAAASRLQSILEMETAELSPAMVRLALGVAFRSMGDEPEAVKWIEAAYLAASNAFERAAARDLLKAPALAPPAPPPVASPGRGWSVQVASTASRAEADTLIASLKSAGWPVFEEAAEVRGQPYTRIRVGPFASQSDAYSARKRLRSELHLDGWITRR